MNLKFKHTCQPTFSKGHGVHNPSSLRECTFPEEFRIYRLPGFPPAFSGLPSLEVEPKNLYFLKVPQMLLVILSIWEALV